MREKYIEMVLKKRVEELGGLCLKWSGQAGVPDRIVLLPEDLTIYVETKAPGGRLRPIQQKMIEKMRRLGHDVRIIASAAEARTFKP